MCPDIPGKNWRSISGRQSQLAVVKSEEMMSEFNQSPSWILVNHKY